MGGAMGEGAVVGCAAVWVGEDGVGFADEHEALGGGGVGGVCVWVVGFGEGIEGFLDILQGGIWTEIEGFIVVGCGLGCVLEWSRGVEGVARR